MQPKSRDRRAAGGDRGVRDVAISRLAAQQHAVVSGRQLRELGLGYGAIKDRVNSGRLRRLRRGIYMVGPTMLPLSREMAAILACGPCAVLSHQNAAALHQLLPHPAKDAPIAVTVGPTDPGPRPGIRIHRTSRLQPDETTFRHRIPVTTPARTLLDLATTLTAGQLEQAVATAHRKRLATPQALHALIARYPHRPGVPDLRALLAENETPAFTRSNAERRLLELIRRAGLPEPRVNAQVAGFEVDFLWAEQHVVVEMDGPTFHSTRPDRRRDHARDAELSLLGYTVLRLDPDELAERSEGVVALLARATR